jgi:hypothetical protein
MPAKLADPAAAQGLRDGGVGSFAAVRPNAACRMIQVGSHQGRALDDGSDGFRSDSCNHGARNARSAGAQRSSDPGSTSPGTPSSSDAQNPDGSAVALSQ